MAQDVDIIDLRRSYLPIAPDSMPVTLQTSGGEDAPEARVPMLPYDGYNFMPTVQGYASFFGINSLIGIDAITSDVDDLFMIQTRTYSNLLVALTDSGIWTKRPNASGAWEHVIVLATPANHREWSKCVIDNVVYAYRSGEAHIWVASPANSYIFTEVTPTGINMEGQLGIFKAGGRLGFWDSENSTGWSSLTAPTTFGNADELSGFTIFQDIVGRIVVVLQHGDGFIIYCTKSIVHVRRNVGSAMLFQGTSIYNNNGISYRREAVFADPDTIHFAFSTQGIAEIVDGKAQIVMPEIGTYLKEKRQPVFLQMINGRYLHFHFLDPYYVQGRVSFRTELITGSVFSWRSAAKALDDWNSGAGNLCRAMNAVDKNMAQIVSGASSKATATDPASVPIYEDHLVTLLSHAALKAWKQFTPGFFGDYQFFNSFGWGGGFSIPSITGGTLDVIPSGMMPYMNDPETYHLVDAPAYHVEANQQDFYLKQEMIFWAEERYMKDWQKAIERKDHGTTVGEWLSIYAGNSSTPPEQPADEIYTFGPFVDLSVQSEANRYYGAADKSAWLQRSLTRVFYVKMNSHIFSQFDVGIVGWYGGPTGGYFASFGEVMAGAMDILVENFGADPTNVVETAPPPSGPHVHAYRGSAPGVASIYWSPGTIAGSLVAVAPGTVAAEIYGISRRQEQTIQAKRFEYYDIPTCKVKELGYTKITGHGHYDLGGSFIVDDGTDEATDYVDICDADPVKKKRPQFNDRPIGTAGQGICGQNEELTINGASYQYPELTVAFPDSEIFLQDGSPEPLHPIFLGAHVFDIQYKKWGKSQVSYKLLMDFYPINNVAGDGPIPYDTFLPKAAALLPNGKIAVFDEFPDDSQIVFGKYGSYRKGYTDLHEVKLQHRIPFTGYLTIETSIDGRNVEPSLTVSSLYDNTRQHNAGYSLSGRWYNIIVEGNYDLIHLEARSSRAGRR